MPAQHKDEPRRESPPPPFVCGLLLGLGCVVSAQKGFRRYKEKGEDTVTLERQEKEG